MQVACLGTNQVLTNLLATGKDKALGANLMLLLCPFQQLIMVMSADSSHPEDRVGRALKNTHPGVEGLRANLVHRLE